MRARRFTQAGLDAFQQFVLQARDAAKRRETVPPVPQEWLVEDQFSEPTPYELPPGEPRFETKNDIGAFVSSIVPDSEYEEVRGDASLWTWFAARYFDKITSNRRKIKEPRAYVAGISFQEFYRHLILGPYYLYFTARDNPDRVKVLMYDEPTTMNEVMVQFGSYQTLMQNRELQSMLQRLYFDETRQRIKKGAGGKGAGTPRRLMDFFRQIELNYDLPSIKADTFWDMLPKEFEKFKQQTAV
jgi:hypothetical protein